MCGGVAFASKPRQSFTHDFTKAKQGFELLLDVGSGGVRQPGFNGALLLRGPCSRWLDFRQLAVFSCQTFGRRCAIRCCSSFQPLWMVFANVCDHFILDHPSKDLAGVRIAEITSTAVARLLAELSLWCHHRAWFARGMLAFCRDNCPAAYPEIASFFVWLMSTLLAEGFALHQKSFYVYEVALRKNPRGI